ncbi:hypothetical protein ACFQRB_17495 [Halobaculum litoreum]|uniref:Uncharacterized protein n=1 Tax=Halobaculum litoreum TaxID=3031998 RepID=A0ABD5XXG3_9EURY
MRKFAERNEDFESLVESFDAYLEARGDLLPVLKSLIHRPLVRLVGDDDLMEKAQNYLSVYQKTQKTLDRKYMSLRDASAQGADGCSLISSCWTQLSWIEKVDES